MSTERNYQVLLAPHVSEKAALSAEAGQHVFKVAIDSTKTEIKAAVEGIFGVTVQSVQVVKVKGKQKRFGQMMGRRKDWKKAVIRLNEGQEIDFSSFGGQA